MKDACRKNIIPCFCKRQFCAYSKQSHEIGPCKLAQTCKWAPGYKPTIKITPWINLPDDLSFTEKIFKRQVEMLNAMIFQPVSGGLSLIKHGCHVSGSLSVQNQNTDLMIKSFHWLGKHFGCVPLASPGWPRGAHSDEPRTRANRTITHPLVVTSCTSGQPQVTRSKSRAFGWAPGTTRVDPGKLI